MQTAHDRTMAELMGQLIETGAEGMSQRQAARHFNISRDSVRKILAFSVPPG